MNRRVGGFDRISKMLPEHLLGQINSLGFRMPWMRLALPANVLVDGHLSADCWFAHRMNLQARRMTGKWAAAAAFGMKVFILVRRIAV